MTTADGDVPTRPAKEPWPNAAERAARAVAAQRTPAWEHPLGELPDQPVALTARPRIEDDHGLLGLTRRSHSRWGSLAFTLFFYFIFALIVIQMVVTLLNG